MSFILRVVRLAAIVLISLFYVLWSVPYQFMGWKGRRKIAGLMRLWANSIAKAIGLRIKVFGNVPVSPAGLVVSNHTSYLDIVAHASILDFRFAPRAEIEHWSALGGLISLTHPVWVYRGSKTASNKTLREYKKTIKNGLHLIVYPEGTSSDGKNGVLPFRSTPFEAALGTRSPVYPMLTRHIEVPGRPTVCWYGDMTLVPHMWTVLAFPSTLVEVYFLKPIYPEGMSRKELATYVHDEMDREYRRIAAG